MAAGWTGGRGPSEAGRAGRLLEPVALVAALVLNWLLAATLPSAAFSLTAIALFGWLCALIARRNPRGFILLLPLVITRGATMVSFVAIENGATMPEVNRTGMPGDASASFIAFTAIFFLSYAIVFRRLERPLTAAARSDLLDRLVAALAWPVILACVVVGAAAFASGVRSGFPLIASIDRFLYRRYYATDLVVILLDNKYLLGALLGTIAFSPSLARPTRLTAGVVAIGLTGLYFLFGDKFFTILTEICFFLMPFLLRRSDRLGALLWPALPIAAGLTALSSAATLYIYTDYGTLPLDRGLTSFSERIAEQGELWYVASRDTRSLANWDGALAARYVDVLDDQRPPASAFRNGIETYYFIQRYAPAKLAASFRSGGGWVQLSMGTEAMALVMFGFVGVGLLMALAGALVAIASLFVLRTLISGFPLSLCYSVWTYLQVYFAVQQASLWPIAAPGQIKRALLFVTIEFVLFAINRVDGRVIARVRPRPRGVVRS